MMASISYTWYYWFMCLHWLEYVRLNRKDWLKNMRATKLEVAMLADVSGAYSAISSVNLCVTGPLWHKPSSLPLDVLDCDWSTKRSWRGPWILTICYGLRVKIAICQLLRLKHGFSLPLKNIILTYLLPRRLTRQTQKISKLLLSWLAFYNTMVYILGDKSLEYWN